MWQLIQELIAHPEIFVVLAFMAAIPVGLYMWFFLKNDPQPNRLVIKTFLFGCLSVVPIALMQYLFIQFDDYNVYDLIQNSVSNTFLMWTLYYMFVGITEEYAKHWVVHVADDHDRGFRRIVDGIELSIVAALGFSFVEHIFYFFSIYQQFGWDGLMGPYIVRSIITTLAHASFSGIYGYYYGKSHFTKSLWHREKIIFRGLISAMILHAIFNTLLEFNMVWPIIPMLMLELSFILYELKSKPNRYIHMTKDLD